MKNLPDTADEDHLEMFFEHKRQGGGTVKRVTIHKDDGLAIIEFQEANGAVSFNSVFDGEKGVY